MVELVIARSIYGVLKDRVCSLPLLHHLVIHRLTGQESLTEKSECGSGHREEGEQFSGLMTAI